MKFRENIPNVCCIYTLFRNEMKNVLSSFYLLKKECEKAQTIPHESWFPREFFGVK